MAVKTAAKLTFLVGLVGAIALATTVSGWAQVQNRILTTPQTAVKTKPVKPGEPPPLFIVNDNIVTYTYVPTATDPGAGKTPKNVLSFTHFDIWTYGTNFFNIDLLKATNSRAPPLGAPAAPCDQNDPADPPGSQRCPGYTEVYGFFRSTLGWNQLSGTNAFSIGPLSNIEFIVGGDFNSDNTTEASAKRAVMGGLQFDFATPYKGSLNAAVMAYQEWQHDGFAATFPVEPDPNPSGNVQFDPTWHVEINYVQPLADMPFRYRALVVIQGQKGCGEPCEPAGPGPLRAIEYLVQQQLVFDVGQVLWNEPLRYVIFGGYRWWKNKFGIGASQPPGTFPGGTFPGTSESTWMAGTAIKF